MASKQIVVDIADMKVAKGPDITLTTYALGSCIGLCIYDPVVKVGGMLHFMLPESKINPEKARLNPFMFADTGVPPLFLEAYKLGAEKKRLIVSLAGGANVLDQNGYFNIGKRNYMASRKILFKNNVLIKRESVGGNAGKTMRLSLDEGRVTIKMPNGQEQEI